MAGDPLALRDAEARIRTLEAQLEHVKNLHERAEGRLSHLLSCPNDIALHQANLYNPEIAVPLLQCYDADIAQLKDKVTVLIAENREIRADNDELRAALQRVSDGRSALVEARVAEERTAVQREEDSLRVKALTAELERRNADYDELQREAAALREQLSNGHVASSKIRDEQHRREKQIAEVDELNAQLRIQLDELTRQLAASQKQVQSLKTQDSDEKALLESQRVQIQLLSQENEDKMQELDRLRAKMVHVLHQAGENHNTHLRIVEEKHADSLRILKEEGRAHEITSAKLRAQLARVDHNTSYSGAGALVNATHVVEAQARHAQELELKRLYAELASAHLQRDDAVARLDHVTALHRSDSDERVRELTRSLDMAKSRQRELEDRVARLEIELEKSREATAAARAEHRNALAERTRLEKEKHDSDRALEESRRAKNAAEAAREAAEAAAADQAERDRRSVRSLERRLEDTKHEHLSLKDRLTAELEQVTRTSEEHRVAAREASQRLESTMHVLSEKERAHDALVAKCERLGQGLMQHKQQLGLCDERLMALNQREAQLVHEVRTHTVAMEQLRAEAARTARERDRAVAEAQLLSQHLQKLAKQHGARLPVALGAAFSQ